MLCGDRFMSAFDRRVDPEVREVRRLEVITGALGRRRWSIEAKAQIVAESLAPRVVISKVARRHDLRLQQVFAWRHQATQGRLALPAAGAVVRAGGWKRNRCAGRRDLGRAGRDYRGRARWCGRAGSARGRWQATASAIPSGWDLHGGWAVRNPTSICVAVPGSRRRYRFSRHRPHGVCR